MTNVKANPFPFALGSTPSAKLIRLPILFHTFRAVTEILVSSTNRLLEISTQGAEIGEQAVLKRRTVMLSKCANPTCSASFRRLGSGRLFRFEVRSPSEPCRDVPDSVCSAKSGRASVFFWLCKNCKLTHTLSFDSARGLTVQPVPTDHGYGPAGQGVELARMSGQAS